MFGYYGSNQHFGSTLWKIKINTLTNKFLRKLTLFGGSQHFGKCILKTTHNFDFAEAWDLVRTRRDKSCVVDAAKQTTWTDVTLGGSFYSGIKRKWYTFLEQYLLTRRKDGAVRTPGDWEHKERDLSFLVSAMWSFENRHVASTRTFRRHWRCSFGLKFCTSCNEGTNSCQNWGEL